MIQRNFGPAIYYYSAIATVELARHHILNHSLHTSSKNLLATATSPSLNRSASAAIVPPVVVTTVTQFALGRYGYSVTRHATRLTSDTRHNRDWGNRAVTCRMRYRHGRGRR